MGVQNQRLNRWLLELQSILNKQGLIDPGQVEGLPQAYVQVGDNTINIATLGGIVNALVPIVAANTVNIATLQTEVSTLQTQMTALTARVVALEARGEVLNGSGVPAAGLGKVKDWYADTTGSHIYVKTAVATWTLIL